jgi:DNA invertase Pin-like site-specific DNA recombinase
MRVGYVRVSTLDRSPDLQLQALAAVCGKVYGEKASGTRTDRPEVRRVLDDVPRDGDTLVVWKLDRLACFLKQLIATGRGSAQPQYAADPDVLLGRSPDLR